MESFAPKIYKYQETPQSPVLDTEEELWKWEALYKDNTSLRQFDDDTGKFHKMAEIDTTRLHALRIISHMYDHSYTLLFPDEPFELFIKHYRTTLAIGAPDEAKFTMFVFGYKTASEKKSYLVVLPGCAIVTDDYNKLTLE